MMSLRGKPVVACVDDDAAVLRALYRDLACEDFRVWLTTRPDRMRGWIEGHAVRLMITDQRMPCMAGTDLLEEAGRLSPETARVVLTAYPQDVLAESGLQARSEGIVTKPWDSAVLRRIIRDLMGKGERCETAAPSREGGRA